MLLLIAVAVVFVELPLKWAVWRGMADWLMVLLLRETTGLAAVAKPAGGVAGRLV